MALGWMRRPTALTLLLWMAGHAGAWGASSPATFRGRVLDADGVTPRTGVVVALYDPRTEGVVRSTPTDARGSFRIEGAAAGSYALLAETPQGAFLAAGEVRLSPGENRPLSLALQPTPPIRPRSRPRSRPIRPTRCPRPRPRPPLTGVGRGSSRGRSGRSRAASPSPPWCWWTS
jgi:hypothetical protein